MGNYKRRSEHWVIIKVQGKVQGKVQVGEDLLQLHKIKVYIYQKEIFR